VAIGADDPSVQWCIQIIRSGLALSNHFKAVGADGRQYAMASLPGLADHTLLL